MSRNQKIIMGAGIAGLLIILGFAIFGNQGYTTYLRKKNVLRTIEANNQTLIQKNEEYADTLDRLQSDSSYLESLSREKYGLVLPDEIIVRPPARVAPTDSAEENR